MTETTAPTTAPAPGAPASSLPRQWARTRRFTLGAPRSFTIASDGGRVLFLRSRAGDDPLTRLWALDVATGAERLIADPRELEDPAAGTELPPEERTRRERMREQATGITAYAADRAARLAAFALSGRLWVADTGEPARVRELPAATPVADPRPSPAGTAVAYVSGGGLRVIGADGSGDRALATPETPDVSYGLPEHVAAESMGRHRGYWWAPDGSRLLVARVDVARVQRWYIADPANPGQPPRVIAYPAVGTANADVTLWVLGLDGSRVEVRWDRAAHEYVVAACWAQTGLLIVVQSRSQRSLRLLAVDPVTGRTRLRREDTDPCWVHIVPGIPAVTGAGALVWAADTGGTRRLLADGAPVTPDGLNVREVTSADGDTVLFTASAEPSEIGLWAYSPGAGARPVEDSPGLHEGWRAGGTTVVVSESLGQPGARAAVYRDGRRPAVIASLAEIPVLAPRPEVLRLGARELRTVVLLPSWHRPGSGRLPVLMDPYGGPAGQRVLAWHDGYLTSQWFAEQGFAVVIADGSGTPGRGPAWEREIYGDLAGPVLEDQVAALRTAAERFADLDLGRVGIRGWSFGGYLAALAVLRRPDVFHAAVSGAGVVDQRLYDTHFKERYLGHPDEAPEAYDRSSLILDAPRLRRPLMLVHGLADDNVIAANTLRLSAALLAAGRPHTVLPLAGVSHMTPQEKVTENLLVLQADFLKRALGAGPGTGEPSGPPGTPAPG
ncbi:MAG TPA: prolyl oligopeptidase family serine peptidase [Streptosporangiaceae bacterium]|nr:prolyl oligopeptidase family serine peptidase [Streptosporangiaceae bacterium]